MISEMICRPELFNYCQKKKKNCIYLTTQTPSFIHRMLVNCILKDDNRKFEQNFSHE